MKSKIHQLLRHLEKYTKTDMVYLAEGMSWLSVEQVVSALTSLVFAIVVANLLPKEIYGTYKYILSVVGIIGIATLPGINVAINRAVSRNNDGELDRGLKERFKWGTISAIASLAIAIYYFSVGNTTLSIAFVVVALLAPQMEALSVYQAFLNGKKEFRARAYINITMQVVAYAVLIGTILLTDNLVSIIFAYFGSWTILRLWSFYISRKKYKTNNEIEEGTVKYGKNLTVVSIVEIISNNLDKILLFYFLGPAQAAIYSIAVAIPDQIRAIPGSLRVLSRPKFAVRSTREIYSNLKRRIFVFVLVILVVVVAYILIAPYLFELLFPKYTSSIFYSQVLSLTLFGSVTYIYIALLEAKKKVRDLYLFNIISYSSQIILLLILTPLWGIMGVVISRIAGQAVAIVTGTILVRPKSLAIDVAASVNPKVKDHLTSLLGADIVSLLLPDTFHHIEKTTEFIELNKKLFADSRSSISYEKVLEIERALKTRFPDADLSRVADLQNVLDKVYSQTINLLPEGSHLKEETAERILLEVTPEGVLKHERAKFGAREVLAVARQSEGPEWHAKYQEKLSSLSKDDFEPSKPKFVVIDSGENEFVHSSYKAKPWRMTHSKEAGVIACFTYKKALHLKTPLLLYILVFLHYLFEVNLAGFSLKHTGPEGIKALGIITADKNKLPSFNPNLYSETMFWKNALTQFDRLFEIKESKFFANSLHVGEVIKGEVVSLNLIDLVWDLNFGGDSRAKEYFASENAKFVYHFREAFCYELLKYLRDMDDPKMQEKIIDHLSKGDLPFVKYFK